MRVVFYCQHVLGVGHVFRSLEIVKGLANHEVIMVTGGAEVDFTPPPNMTQESLPGLMMSPDFKEFIPLEDGVTDVDDVLSRRLDRFREIMAQYRPDIFLVELYPFGRRKFRFELLPILRGVNAGEWGPCKAICSVRDILVEKDDPEKYVRRVNPVLNDHFHAVLCHADPSLVTLDETYPGIDTIIPPIHYTGYVARAPQPDAGTSLRQELGLAAETPLIALSIGGGSVGGELLEATLKASPILHKTHPHQLHAFTGPYCTDQNFTRYQSLAAPHPHITLKRFTPRLPAYLDAANLSVSLGGYNTTMNLLAANTYGLILPFAQNREQHMRTAKLEQRGMVGLLIETDLTPATLAKRMAHSLDHPRTSHDIDLDGGQKSGRILENLIGE